MSETEIDAEKKRKRSEKSSLSELERSVNSPDSNKERSKKKKKRTENKQKSESEGQNKTTLQQSKSDETKEMEGIQKELKTINERLGKVLTKDDPSLKKLIKDIFKEMKEEFLKSISHRIDTLENRIFQKEQETDSLKEHIKSLETQLKDQKSEENRLKKEIEKQDTMVKGMLNEQEQYSRRNSVRVSGIDERENENSESTTNKVINIINRNIQQVKIQKSDIDVAHRVGKKVNGKRQVIVKFVSRTTTETILKNKKNTKRKWHLYK